MGPVSVTVLPFTPCSSTVPPRPDAELAEAPLEAEPETETAAPLDGVESTLADGLPDAVVLIGAVVPVACVAVAAAGAASSPGSAPQPAAITATVARPATVAAVRRAVVLMELLLGPAIDGRTQ
ncbi:hypothetical protein MTP03_45390 [Tsukamurella sp. PLM1]|nr:hypothetical protein MTP03_45390 [Tsukamurella sp. PLM1]